MREPKEYVCLFKLLHGKSNREVDNVFKLYGMNGNQYDQKGKSPNNTKKLWAGSKKVGMVRQ